MKATLAIVRREFLKFLRNRGRILNSVIQPLFLVFIFSFVTSSISVGTVSSIQFLIFGIIGITAFSSSMSEAVSFIHDKKSGFVKEYLISPITRTQLVLGRIVGDSLKGIFDAIILVVISVFAGCQYTVLSFALIMFSVLIVCMGGAALGLFIAFNVKTEKEFSARIGLTMLFGMFLSGAYIPLTLFPSYLRFIVYINPLTYLTNYFRYISLSSLGVIYEDLVQQGIIVKILGYSVVPIYPFILFAFLSILFIRSDVKRFKNINRS